MSPKAKVLQQIQERNLIKVKIDSLKFDDKNPNKFTAEQMHALRESMQRFGYLTPVIIDQNNLIADGEHRALLYKEFGLTEIPAYRIKFKSDIERRMLRQVMNKLRGKHDTKLDAMELEAILGAGHDELKDLSNMIAQSEQELKRMISEYSPHFQDYREVDGVAFGMGSLAANWGIPPFSILDKRSETWQQRRKEWLNFGIASEQGREEVVLFGKHLNVRTAPLINGKADPNYRPTVSVYDPVLAEILTRWFCIPSHNAKIIDPFSGGSVRGIVTSFLTHKYTGIDLLEKQVEANEKQYRSIKSRMPKGHHKPMWHAGDSENLDQILGNEKYDMCLTSPPYFHIEHYSDNPNDLNNLDWQNFEKKYSTIIKHVANHMNKNRFVCWNVGNARDNSKQGDGFLVNQPMLTIKAFEQSGFKLYNELVLIHPILSLAFRVSNMFVPCRVVGRTHEYVLVFYNGNKKSVPRIDPGIVEIPETETMEVDENQIGN